MATTQTPSPSAQIRIEPGDLKVSNDPAAWISARALGCAMALSVYDPQARAGGLLLFMYPDSEIRGESSRQGPCFFADTGIPRLITAVCEAGATRAQLICRIAAGSGVIDPEGSFNSTTANRTAAQNILEGLGLSLTAEHIGGHEALGIAFRLRTGALTLILHNGQEIEVS